MSVSTTLKSLEKKWKQEAARAKASPDFKRHPDGRYIGRLSEAKVDEGERLQSVLIFVILEGDLTGEVLRKYDGLDGEESLFYLAKLLSRFGYDPEEVSIGQLPQIYKELTEEKPVCKLRAKTKGDFQNVYLEDVLEDYEEEEGAEDEEDEEEEEPAPTPAKRGPGRPRKTEAAPPVEEDESEEDESDEVEVEIGMRVAWQWKGEELEGEIIELVDDEKCRVQADSGKRCVVRYENLAMIETGETDSDEDEEDENGDEEEDEEEEEEAPPVKRGPGRPRKTAPASTPAASTPAPAKRGPGRPRKTETAPPVQSPAVARGKTSTKPLAGKLKNPAARRR